MGKYWNGRFRLAAGGVLLAAAVIVPSVATASDVEPRRPGPIGRIPDALLPEELRQLAPPSEPKKEEADPAEAQRGPEILSQRTESGRTFATDQPGVYATESSTAPMHARDPNTGSWVEIDPQLQANERGGFDAPLTSAPVSIGSNAASSPLARVEAPSGGSVGFSLDGAAPAPAKRVSETSVVYEDAIGAVDVELTATASGVKETLILDSAADATTYRFKLDVDGGLQPTLEADGAIAFRAKGKEEPALRIPHGWMEDSGIDPAIGRAAFSDAVSYSLQQEQGQWVLEVGLDREWLRAPERVFPVRVDPTLTGTVPGLDDTMVSSYFPTTDLSSALWSYVGAGGLWDIERSFTHLPVYDGALAGMTIHGASLNVWQFTGHRCDAGRDLFRVTDPWTGSTTNFSNQPAVGDLLAQSTASFAGPGSGCETPATISYDITQAARNWADGTWDNNGVSLWASNPGFTSPSQQGVFGTADNGIYTPYTLTMWSDPGATGIPEAPSNLMPNAAVDTDEPVLSATYRDYDGDPGYVIFRVFDEATGFSAWTGLGSTAVSGATSSVQVPPSTLTMETTYRLEAFSVDDPLGLRNPFDPTTNGSSFVTSSFRVTTGPFPPAQVAPSGKTADPTPQLSAVYEDRDAETGFVRFKIYDTSTNLLVATVDSASVASGTRATATVGSGLLSSGSTYRIEATSIDVGNRVSDGAVTFDLNVDDPEPAVIDDDFPDPDVVQDGATYYAYATNTDFANTPVRSSSDLANWNDLGEAFPLENMGDWSTNSTGNTWAPAVRRFGETWVLYYTARDNDTGKQCIGVATSDDPEGPFEDGDGRPNPPDPNESEGPLVCGSVILGDPEDDQDWTFNGVIDAETFTDTDGDIYLLWKNDGNGVNGPVSLWSKELDPSGLAFAGSDAPVQLLSFDEDWEAGGDPLNLIEQPEMILRNQVYYLFYSGNAWPTANYAEGYAVCPSGPDAACEKQSTSSPWLGGTSSSHSPRPTFETSTAHGPGAVSFFEGDGIGGRTTWMAYHGWPTASGRSAPSSSDRVRGMYIDKVDFTAPPDPDDPKPDFFFPHAAAVGMVDTGDLGYGSWATSISNFGQVGGHTWPGVMVPTEASLWGKGSGWQSFGGFAWNGTSANGVNDSGRMAGFEYTGSSTTSRFARRWSTSGGGTFELLRALEAGQPSEAIAINNDGSAVGFSYDDVGDWRPVLWPSWGGVIKLFGDNEVEPGSYTAQANAINDSGDVAGYYCLYVVCYVEAFYLPQYGSPIGLGDLGQGPTVATGLNNNGQVVGYSSTALGEQRAFIWDSVNGMVDLFDAVPWATESWALGVNDRGQVVGGYVDATLNITRGFLYDPESGLFDVGDLDPTGEVNAVATAINEDGLITGNSYNEFGSLRAFVRSTADPS